MKKIYNAPSTVVLQIKTGHLLTNSLDVKSGETITNPSNILSRRRNSVWDDDEEDF